MIKTNERHAIVKHETYILEREHFQRLLDVLKNAGYSVIGPTLYEGAIIYDEVSSTEDFPIGWTDHQGKGSYRLEKRDDHALFGYNVSPHAWKRFLNPPRLQLWKAKKTENGFQITSADEAIPRYAFIGVRACELHAILIQDQVFLGGDYVDSIYKNRRENTLIIAVNCNQMGENCFCTSMGTGPQVTHDFDLALTEVLDGHRHYFVVEVGSEHGIHILSQIPHQTSTENEQQMVEQLTTATRQQAHHTLDITDLKDLLLRNVENPYWDEVAQRCLTCGNCTLVCPTCFCTTVEDVTDLTGEHAERIRLWDSCFTMDFSYIHGGSVRYSSKARYRQWLTHKLATWVDQFGTFGCVGCGRCITWCPVGIDLTQEALAIRENDGAKSTIRKDKGNGH